MEKSIGGMNIRIPKEVIDYLDEVRGEKSRQAYIISRLVKELEERKRGSE